MHVERKGETMTVCYSCGETVTDNSNICPFCFGKVEAPATQASAPIELSKAEVAASQRDQYDAAYDDDDDDEITLAPAEPIAITGEQRRPGKTDGTQAPTNFDPSAADNGLCPNCREVRGAAADLCTACGFHFGLGRVLASDENEDEDDYGFPRLIRRALNDDTDLTTVSVIAHAVALVVGGIFYAQIPATRWVLVPVCLGYALFRVLDLIARGAYRQAFGNFLWLGVLQVMRATWRDPRSPGKKLRVLIANRDSYGDRDLIADSVSLNAYDAIDLENASITDAGLVALFAKPNLRFIVLRGTKVSPTAARRLQRNRPNAWIWL
jgi:hypothetical protein